MINSNFVRVDLKQGAAGDDFQYSAILIDDEDFQINYFMMKDGSEETWYEDGPLKRTGKLLCTQAELEMVRKAVSKADGRKN